MLCVEAGPGKTRGICQRTGQYMGCNYIVRCTCTILMISCYCESDILLAGHMRFKRRCRRGPNGIQMSVISRRLIRPQADHPTSWDLYLSPQVYPFYITSTEPARFKSAQYQLIATIYVKPPRSLFPVPAFPFASPFHVVRPYAHSPKSCCA